MLVRVAFVAALALLGTGSAAGADATPAPRLVVHGHSAKAASEIALEHLTGVDTALVRIDASYALALGQAPGTVLGSASAQQLVDASSHALNGPVSVAPPDATACDGAAHAAIWSIALGDGTQTVATVTVGVDPAPAQLVLCLGGTQLDSVALHLAATVLTPPKTPAHPVWEALFSLPGGDQLASVATLALPERITIRGAYQRYKHAIALAGTLREAGVAPAVARRVVVSVGTSGSALAPIGSTGSYPDGSWRGTLTNAKHTLYVRAQVVVRDADTTATACAPPTFVAPCGSATAAGYVATSQTIRVQVR
jgi:hypothetical protein